MAKAMKKPGGKRRPSRLPERLRHVVEVDEKREQVGEPAEAFGLGKGEETDALAEELGEEYVQSATSGEEAAEDIRDEDLPEEHGGPFVETSGRTEFAQGTDESNPSDAEPAAFPTVSRGTQMNASGIASIWDGIRGRPRAKR
jgi:hypothetical protein